MPAKFELKKTTNQQYMFNLRAGNNQIILTSERYESEAGAKKGIESVRTNAVIDERYERLQSGDQHYFVLRAANHQVIGSSERYTTAAMMEKGIASVKTNAPDAPVAEAATTE